MLRRRPARRADAGLTGWRQLLNKQAEVTGEEKELIFQRSMIYRQAEKDLQGAKDGEGEGAAKAAHKEARQKWRDATDRVAKKYEVPRREPP